jgi:hypothetical protein
VKFLLWADSYFFRGVSGQLPSLKEYFSFISDEFIYRTYRLLKFHSYTFLQPKSNFYGKLSAVVLFGKDESVLSNQNT